MAHKNIILENNKAWRITDGIKVVRLLKFNKKILHTTGIKPLQIQLFGSTIIGRIKLNDERDNNRKR